MPFKGRIIVLLFSLALFIFVLNLIRKRQLKIEHSILWLLVGAVILLASIWQDFADNVAYFVGIDYPPALFLSIAIFFSLGILMHFSLELSKLKDHNKTLTQEIAIHKNLVKKLEKKLKSIDESHTAN